MIRIYWFQQLQASLTHKDAELEDYKAQLTDKFNDEVQNYTKKVEAAQQAIAQRGKNMLLSECHLLLLVRPHM